MGLVADRLSRFSSDQESTQERDGSISNRKFRADICYLFVVEKARSTERGKGARLSHANPNNLAYFTLAWINPSIPWSISLIYWDAAMQYHLISSFT